MPVMIPVGNLEVWDWEEVDEKRQELLMRAAELRENSAVMVSGYTVGSTLVDNEMQVHEGCNLEEGAFNASLHAEWLAAAKMRSDKKRGDPIWAVDVFVALGPKDQVITNPPTRSGPAITSLDQDISTICGHCRCFVYQYGKKSTRVWALQANGQVFVGTLGVLYPAGFRLDECCEA